MTTKERLIGKEVTPREAIELMIEHGDCTAEDIAEWAYNKEDEMYLDEALITEARERVVDALMDYNSVLGFNDELEPEFWETLFDYYEESMNYLHSTVDAIRDAVEDITREEKACKDCDGKGCKPSQTKEEDKEESCTLSDLIEMLISGIDE